MVGGTPGGKGRLIQILGERFEDIVEGIEPTEPPPLCTSRLDFIQGDLPPVAVHSIAVRLSDSDGKLLGHVLVYGSGLPAGILALVARGDPGMLERMTRLHRPGKRRAALLFADLQSSGILTRRLSSAAYFRFAQSLTTAMDEVVVRRNGIIGKHAGDGLTAFFLAEHLGSASAAARAAIESARAIRHAAAAVAGELGDAGLIQPRDCLVNVGIHWGATLYMGQLVTGGRLEITALGDEVNQCARIQQSARGGEALASKALLEHLCEADASALGLDPEAIMYRMVAELPEADAKALRDAGGLPVASV
jgi:class 3 adenylate cyclase